MNHWKQYSFGHLPDGSRVMLAFVESDYPSRMEFPAVLICRPDGLYRLWRDGRRRLLAPGYAWPHESQMDCQEAEISLRQQVPKAWGIQRRSGVVIQQIPARILNAKTENLPRLLMAWFVNEQVTFAAGCARMEQHLRPSVPLPAAPLWRPVAITVVPNTDVVVRALDTGVLLHRLKQGLERIYVSEMAWIRAPRIEASLRALAHRFPARLVLVKAENYRLQSGALKIRRERASEFQFIGYQLQSRYEADFGYDKFAKQSALDGIFRFRIGDMPRGTGMLWLHEMPVDFEQWTALDLDGMLGEFEQCTAMDLDCFLQIESLALERLANQDQKGGEALAQAFEKDD